MFFFAAADNPRWRDSRHGLKKLAPRIHWFFLRRRIRCISCVLRSATLAAVLSGARRSTELLVSDSR